MVKFTSEMKTSGFELIPEGVTILRVEELKPVMNMGRVKEYKAKFVDSKGRMLFNNYNVNPKNKWYTQAMRSFYSLLKTGCELYEDAEGEIDETQAVGCYIVARINHREGSDGRIFQNLGYIFGSAGDFDDDVLKDYIAQDNAYSAKVKESKPELIEDDIIFEDENEDDPYA